MKKINNNLCTQITSSCSRINTRETVDSDHKLMFGQSERGGKREGNREGVTGTAGKRAKVQNTKLETFYVV